MPTIAVRVTSIPMVMAAHTHMPKLVPCDVSAIAVGVIERPGVAVTVGVEVAIVLATMVGVALGVGVIVEAGVGVGVGVGVTVDVKDISKSCSIFEPVAVKFAQEETP